MSENLSRRDTDRKWLPASPLVLLGLLFLVGCDAEESAGLGQVPTSASPDPSSAHIAQPRAMAREIPFDKVSTNFANFSSEDVRQAAMRYPAVTESAVEAPISLTADDGTGLGLESLEVRTVIEGPLAFTELHMRFRNPVQRVLEGRFQLTLPEGASVSRLAMKTSAGWQEAEMVERQEARRVYEDFLHRKQDPMLLEKEAGNQFRARIFPIPAGGTKDVIVSYSHELSSQKGYRLALRGLPKIGELKVNVMVAEKDGASSRYKPRELYAQETVPTEDFIVAASATLRALHQGNHVVARVQPKLEVETSPIAALTILFDTSASRAPSYGRQVQRLGSLIETIAHAHGTTLPLTVAAFDQRIALIYDGNAGDFGQTQQSALLARRPLGASDIGAALQWAGRQEGQDRLLVIGDGISTAGEAELGNIAKSLPQAISRIDALLIGGIRDRESAGRMVRGTRSHDGVILRDDFSDEEIVRRLGDATATIKVSIEGATWNWPNTVNGVQPGDEVVVYGAFGDGQAATESVVVKIEGSSDITMSSSLVPGQLLTRSVVQAQISRNQNELIAEETKAKKASLQKAIIALSTKYRVLSDYTALLVLESDSDYRRFGIDRRALVDILGVQETGLRIEQRQRNIPKPRVPAFEGVAGVVGNKQDSAANNARNESARATGQFAMRNNDNNARPSPARTQAWDRVRRSGILGVIATPGNNGEGRAFAQLSGSPDFMQSEGTAPGRYSAIVAVGQSGYGTVGQNGYGAIGHGGQGAQSGYEGNQQGNWGMTVRGEPGQIPPDIIVSEFRPSHRQSGQRNRRFIPQVRPERALVRGALGAAFVRRYVRRKLARIRFCYERELVTKPDLEDRVVVQFEINPDGRVKRASQESGADQRLGECIVRAIESIRFPTTDNATKVRYPFTLAPPEAARTTTSARTQTPQATQAWGDTGDSQELPPRVDPSIAAKKAEAEGPPALTGRMASIHQAIERGAFDEAVASALAWRTEESGSVMALVALGEALEAADKSELAARAYGSIIDLFPSRADLRRFASARLIALGARGIELSIDSLKKAAAQRPGHLSVHRLLGYAMLRNGDLQGAFSAIEQGLVQRYPSARFAGGFRILQEDLGIIGQAWLAKDSSKRSEIKKRLLVAKSSLATKASLRFVLNWETDANDVDFHIYDGRGGHAFYREPGLATGGNLYADVTTGYGPECFAIEGLAMAFPYALQIHYYSRGPMGYGMGQVEIMQHDGKGGLKFDVRPFVAMNDNAFVTLEPITKAL